MTDRPVSATASQSRSRDQLVATAVYPNRIVQSQMGGDSCNMVTMELLIVSKSVKFKCEDV